MSINKKVSLLTLFNILNSLVLFEGRVLIIITNYIKRLDPALICSSYVNIKVKFYLIKEDIIS
ncbi:hypothetical protein K469DRAFT_549460 [Zopfia rhizophila CBS 207.26]|uniref:ATPase AAA-type core domain-containing protein n=1 Tax=Zopfia rhizophila CBS 207.26 TaxID=1314779 RepID=A0A6A6ESV1_9PEZI|nr:hypothetical protein K469DRAFT_549460 [Zopfia rhizophila CBS 207.26]